MRSSLLLVAVACASPFAGPRLPVDVHPEEVTPCGFEPIGGTRMSRYACNPMVEPDAPWSTGTLDVGMRVEMVLGHPVFQMWIAGRIDDRALGPYAMGMATSDNGVDWTPYIRNPRYTSPVQGWDQSGMTDMHVAWHPGLRQYVMLYRGYGVDEAASLGLLASFDGLSWFPHPDSPLLSFDGDGSVSWCGPLHLAWRDNRGLSGLLAGSEDDGPCSVYPMTGLGPDDLRPEPEPLLRAGPEEYDSAGIVSAAQVQVGDAFLMFYVGAARQEDDLLVDRTLNLATSTDGEAWIKLDTNPLPVEAQVDGEISGVTAAVVDDRIHLWLEDTYSSVPALGYFIYEPGILLHP